MAKAITVTALQPLMYQGRSHVRGSVFEATPVDAAALKYRGKVKLGGQLRPASGATVQDHPSIARRMEPVTGFAADVPAVTPGPPMPTTEAPVEPVESPAAEPVTGLAQAPRSARGRRGRGYQRRDMQAEPGTDAPSE